ncbi:MAG: exosortase/archaeosortase family protein, partial [Nitrospirales bacterium]
MTHHTPVASTMQPHTLIFWTIPIIGLLAILYRDIVPALVMDWYNDPDYSHGFLVPFLSAFFIWERWDDLKKVEISPSYWGIGLLGFGLFMLVVGLIGAELYTQRSSLIAVFAGLVLLVGGWKIMWMLKLPLAFLIFMVPLPAIVVNTIAFPLQLFAAKTASFCLFSLGIPVLREGNLIALAGTTLEV